MCSGRRERVRVRQPPSGLPILQQIEPNQGLQFLVLVPTRELAVQVAAELRRYADATALRIVPVYGGQKIKAQLHLLGRKPCIVVGTPGRIMDMMERKALHFDQIRFVVLDEVDRMLDIGFREDIRLHCVPVVNLFAHNAEPIRLEHDRLRYLIQPARTGIADRRHAEIYAVDRVLGLIRAQGLESREFKSFYSFAHVGALDASQATYYQTHVTPSVIGKDARFGTDTWLSFVVGDQKNALPSEETISVELTCTNRDLPRELRAGDICEPSDRSPAGTRFRNLLKPTPTICPPLGQGLHWRLISHMSLNYVSLTNIDHFKELLRVYDFEAAFDAQRAAAHQRRLDGILDIRATYRERMVRGAPIRGLQVDLELNEDHFAGEGDAYLFAGILDRFVAAYVTLNSFTQLNVRFARTGHSHSFAPRWGEHCTPAEMRP